MLSNMFAGIGYALRGLRLLGRPQIRRFVLIPLSINVLLFGVAVYLLVSNFQGWLDALLPQFPGWLQWLESALEWLLWPLFALMIFFLVFYTFSFVANLVAAPFNGLLAEKTELMLNGESTEDLSLLPTWRMIMKSIGSEISKLLYLLKWSVLLLVISFVPVINIAAPPLWMVFGVWMLSLEYLDYPMGNHGHTFREINRQALSVRTRSLGFGSGLFVMTSIPLLNFLVMPAGVVGATLLWVERGGESGGV